VKLLNGRRRLETDRFLARSYYLFSSEFTRGGKEGAYEKGVSRAAFAGSAAAIWCPSRNWVARRAQ